MFNRKLIGNWIKGWRDKLIPTKAPVAPLGRVLMTETEEKLGKDGKKSTFWIETEKFKCSPQKLSMLANQISRTRLSHAIIQMQLSPKKASVRIHQLLMRGKAMVESSVQNGQKKDAKASTEYWVKQAMVGRGSYVKEIDYKAKGRFGIIRHPEAFIRVELAPWDPQADLARTLKAVISKAKQPTTPERYHSPAKINYH